MTDETTVGLGTVSEDQWPSSPPAVDEPIDLLNPKTQPDRHRLVLDYLIQRLEASERKMTDFYSRWQVSEKKIQAYITYSDFEKELKQLNNQGNPPTITHIIVPYSFSVIHTLTTVLLHTFIGRRPMFTVGANNEDSIESARLMELKLQYDADHTRLQRQMHLALQDGQIYGMSVLRALWEEERAMRTVFKNRTLTSLTGTVGSERYRTREEVVTYEGNRVEAVDPYLFFPDPRVPMPDVNKRGEFVFWRLFIGRHTMKKEEAAGNFKHIDFASTTMPRNEGINGERSFRNIMSQASTYGSSHSPDKTHIRGAQNYYQFDQGTVEIIPAELGLGDSTVPEKWIFAILNKDTIIQAEPFEHDHGMHPVAIAEPYTLGYGFGQVGAADYLNPLQDGISWFFNSHMDNVRKVINDMIVVDPSMVEMQDLKRGKNPGKIIRLKRAAYGQDVRSAIQQLQVVDVTQGHVADMENLIRMGNAALGINENLAGQITRGGRRTATESRISSEAGLGRMGAMAQVISAQQMVDLTTMMAVNNMQFLSDEYMVMLYGDEALRTPIRATPEAIVGDYHYPVHDGTMPFDKAQLLMTWEKILQGIATDPEIRQTYDINKVFEFVAELGGARNIESMRRQQLPVMQGREDAVVEQEAQAGNLIPVQDAIAQLGAAA